MPCASVCAADGSTNTCTWHSLSLCLVHFGQRTCMAHMRIHRRRSSHKDENGRPRQYCCNRADTLDKHPCCRQSERLTRKGDHANGTIRTSLERIGNERQPITDIHDVVDGAQEIDCRCDGTQHYEVGSDDIEGP